MYHTDKLSVFLESGDHNQERTLNEFPLLKGDDSKENLTRVVVSIKPRTALRITLQTHEDFDLLDATGLRVTIANSRGVYSSDDVQSWWVPREDLTCPNDTETSWEGFWTWSSDSASRGRRRIVAPAPPYGDFKSTPYANWAEKTNAAPGCIAVYVTRGTLPRVTAYGVKRCTTDPPEGKSFTESAHPIRSEWFRPLPGKVGEPSVFEAANVDQNTLRAMRLGTFPAEIEDEDEETIAERDARQQSDAEALDGSKLPSSAAALGGKRKRHPRWTQPQYKPIAGADSAPPPQPETPSATRKRSHTEGSEAVKKIKTESSPEAEQAPPSKAEVWNPVGDDDELLVLDDNASSRTQASNARVLFTRQPPLTNDGRRAQELSDLRVELAQAEVKLLKEKLARAMRSGGSVV